jgi:polar amino acid transport system permease protein
MFREFTPNEVLFLIGAARWTIGLAVIAFIGGGILGLLVMLLRVSKSRALSTLAALYIQLVQGTPLLGQLFLLYFGLGLLGLRVNPWLAASVALILNSAAFLAEIWRGCVQSIPRTQWEGSGSLGLSFLQQIRYVILPQAVRIAIPPTVGFLVQVIKSTSLASVIGFIELTRAAQIVNAATFRPFLVYLLVGAIYFALCYPLTLAGRRLEVKLHVAR